MISCRASNVGRPSFGHFFSRALNLDVQIRTFLWQGFKPRRPVAQYIVWQDGPFWETFLVSLRETWCRRRRIGKLGADVVVSGAGRLT